MEECQCKYICSSLNDDEQLWETVMQTVHVVYVSNIREEFYMPFKEVQVVGS